MAVGSEVSVGGVVLLSVRVCEVRLLVNCLVSEVVFVLVVLIARSWIWSLCWCYRLVGSAAVAVAGAEAEAAAVIAVRPCRRWRSSPCRGVNGPFRLGRGEKEEDTKRRCCVVCVKDTDRGADQREG